MKKENKIRSIINKSSFQTQLFTIVLLSLVAFIIISYILVIYSFKNKYIKTEIDDLTGSISTMVKKINDDEANTSSYLYSLYQKNGCIPIILDSSSGGYVLKDSNVNEYIIELEDENSTYNVNIGDLSIILNINDNITGYIKENDLGDSYIFKKIYINNNLKIDNTYDESCLYIDAKVKSISKPDNINFLFSKNEFATSNIDVLEKNISKLNSEAMDGASYFSSYLDSNKGYAYYLVKPESYKENDNFIFIISTLVKTDSLLSIVQSYYGYIILLSVAASFLIAMFISYAFSNPIRIVEKEIKKLRNNDYETSSHEFKNRELISLQDSINEVKTDTKNKVLNIKNQNESLEKLNRELLRESELRSSFIARLSHELKTPLMVISATTEALMSGLIKEEDKDKEYNNILDEIDKTTGIIKDIINTYKTTTKEIELNMERFLLNNLVKETLEPLMPIAQNKNLKVVLNLDTKEYINADIKLIEQVVSNFITNAFKYTEDNNKVEISVLDNKNNFRFEVKNYGSTINPTNLDKIWLPFFRENENIDSTSTGMGLYIVKEILEVHKYKYDVTNFSEGVISYFEVNK